CVAQDGPEPMLNRARRLTTLYGKRFLTHLSDLFAVSWLPKKFSPFEAAVSSSCFHNLRDFQRVSEIYHDIRKHLKPGGVFLNEDLISAPTAALQQRHDDVAARRRQRKGVSAEDLQAARVESRSRSFEHVTTDPFPAALEQPLGAVEAAGFTNVDCLWKGPPRALNGGFG